MPSQEPTSRLLERAATQLSSPPRPAPREPVALLYERSLELSLLYQQECGRQCERRISDPILSDISDDHSATSMPLLMSFFKSVWRENEALQARAAEPVPLDPAHPGSSAALIQAVSAWHTAHEAIEEHLRTAQQSTQAAHSLGQRGSSSSSSSSSSAEPAPPPSPSSSSSYTLLPDVHVALLDTALDPFPVQVHMHTQHWLAVHGEVQRLGVEEEERRSQLASQLARLGTISASLASMRAHLLRGEDGTPLAIPTQAAAAAAAAAAQPALLSPAAEAAARSELAALAQSRGRALALADHQRALTQLQADLAAALAEQSQRLPAAQAALPALFLQQAEAEAGQAEAVAEQRLARARAAVGALQARLGLLELQHRVASLMRVRRQRLADWVSVMAARPGKGTLFPAGEGGVGGRRAFSLTSLRALAAGAGAPRAAGSSSSSSSGEAASGSGNPMSLSDAKRRLAGEVAEQRQLAAGALQAMGYSEGLALWLEEGLRRLLPPEQGAEE